jgi:ribonuclease-3
MTPPVLTDVSGVAESPSDGLVPASALAAVARVERIVGHRFADATLAALALTHASLSDSRKDSNERLEFLGDAVLGCLVCERIYAKFPEYLEGEMTKIKSTAVSRRTCAELSDRLGLTDLIRVGKGMSGNGELPRSLAAGVVESVVGALYLDAGLEKVRAFLVPLVDPLIDEAAESGHQKNFKSVLQQHAQQVLGCAPVYRVLDEKGPDHAKAFKVAVEISGTAYEASWGNTKKQAEQQAALHALRTLGVVADDGRVRVIEGEGK